MRKALTALLMVAATSAAADLPWSYTAERVAAGDRTISDYQYKLDLINKLNSDGTTVADLAECMSWRPDDQYINYTSDLANTSGCHFILHATRADLLTGYHWVFIDPGNFS